MDNAHWIEVTLKVRSRVLQDFERLVVRIAHEKCPKAQPYFNTGMEVKRDGRWQMLFSFTTKIQ